ncbi:hypothetical protein AFK24_17300 [Pseudomonas syringae]|uniref:Uncharacterized protein n=1 Tax=Pseudomonas syringae TaxID=317 RepID=A0A1C7Z3V4_PSESX|nr:hypothetical protein AFK24_17300 [Pseudomonas syringae]
MAAFHLVYQAHRGTRLVKGQKRNEVIRLQWTLVLDLGRLPGFVQIALWTESRTKTRMRERGNFTE